MFIKSCLIIFFADGKKRQISVIKPSFFSKLLYYKLSYIFALK